VIALLLAACRCPAPLPPPITATVTGQTMGGDLRITVRCASQADHETAQADALAARDVVDRIAALATDWTAGGEIARVNAAAGDHPVAISADVAAMLATSGTVSAATHGAFDPTVGALWGLWDFDAGIIPADAAIAERLPAIGWDGVILQDGTAFLPRAGMALTLGGIAQGYAASRGLAAIPARDAAVDVSGDVAVRGAWPVGIQHPRGVRGGTFAELVLHDAVLTTSGDYEHGFVRDGVRYHHVLDPRTGRPAHGAISATAVAADGGVADALATALVVLGPDEAAVDALHAWALVVTPDGEVHVLGDPRGMVTDLRAPERLTVGP
jgi:thiamine biosynthesis lipoprotein